MNPERDTEAATVADPRHPDSRPMLGIVLMLVSGFMFVTMDMLAKYGAEDLPVPIIVWGRYVFHLAIMVALFPGVRFSRLWKTKRPIALSLRGGLLAACTLCFFLAIATVPLADANAISFASPLFMVALSIPLLRETVGRRRWAAVVIGFLGILIIVRPGFQQMHWAYLLLLAVALMFAIYSIMTRQLSRDEDPMAMLFYTGLIGALGASLAAPFYWQTPNLQQWLLLLAIGAIGGVSHLIIIHAFKAASASMLAPFQYPMIIWSVLYGYYIFDDVPDAWTIAGATIIIASGFYVWLRETQLARRSHDLQER
jgi:drug/metabolite transporter (DMT)-like permease